MPVDMSISNSIVQNYLRNKELAQQGQEAVNRHQEAQDSHDVALKTLKQHEKEHADALKFTAMSAANELRNHLAEQQANLFAARRQQQGNMPDPVQNLNSLPPQQSQDLSSDLGDLAPFIPKSLQTYNEGEDTGNIARQVRAAQQLGDVKTNQAVTQAGGVAAAEQPFKLEEQQKKQEGELHNLLAIHKLTGDQDMTKAIYEGGIHLKVGKMNADTQRYDTWQRENGENIRSANQIAAIYGTTPGALDATVEAAAVDPKVAAKLNPNDPKSRAIINAMAARKLVPATDLAPDALKAVGMMQPFLSKLEAFAEKQPEKGPGAAIQTAKAKLTGQYWPSDLLTEIAGLKANLTNVATSLEGTSKGRIVGTQLKAALEGIGDPSQRPLTRENALSLVQNLKNMAANVVQSNLDTVSPEQQDLIVARHNVVLPSIIKAPEFKNFGGKVVRKNLELSRKAGKPVYSDTNSNGDIE